MSQTPDFNQVSSAVRDLSSLFPLIFFYFRVGKDTSKMSICFRYFTEQVGQWVEWGIHCCHISGKLKHQGFPPLSHKKMPGKKPLQDALVLLCTDVGVELGREEKKKGRKVKASLVCFSIYSNRMRDCLSFIFPFFKKLSALWGLRQCWLDKGKWVWRVCWYSPWLKNDFPNIPSVPFHFYFILGYAAVSFSESDFNTFTTHESLDFITTFN